jgi:hypothetical protein
MKMLLVNTREVPHCSLRNSTVIVVTWCSLLGMIFLYSYSHTTRICSIQLYLESFGLICRYISVKCFTSHAVFAGLYFQYICHYWLTNILPTMCFSYPKKPTILKTLSCLNTTYIFSCFPPSNVS